MSEPTCDPLNECIVRVIASEQLVIKTDTDMSLFSFFLCSFSVVIHARLLLSDGCCPGTAGR